MWQGYIIHGTDNKQTAKATVVTQKSYKSGEMDDQMERWNNQRKYTNIRLWWRALGKAFILLWTSEDWWWWTWNYKILFFYFFHPSSPASSIPTSILFLFSPTFPFLVSRPQKSSSFKSPLCVYNIPAPYRTVNFLLILGHNHSFLI